jgi:hypothetical protein
VLARKAARAEGAGTSRVPCALALRREIPQHRHRRCRVTQQTRLCMKCHNSANTKEAIKMSDLTAIARTGYEAPTEDPNPYYYSSANHSAYALGRYLRQSGRTSPRDVRMSRGYSIRANDMLFKIRHAKSTVSFERTN